jgi:ligand-binding sensor domain-containing protein
MTADLARLRRARRAIYGPPIAAVVGVALIAAGVIGLITHRNEANVSRSSSGVLVPPATLDAANQFVLVDTKGRLYPGGAAGPGKTVRAEVPAGATIVAAATAQDPDGGHWLATRDGRVIGVGTKSLGQHQVGRRTSQMVGIAAASTRGYWLARADGHVYAFGARQRGDLSRTRHAPVVGIAATPDGGYWLAMSDGKVKGFGTARKGSTLRRRNAHIVGIAASGNGGYWLAGADGRVYPYGAPRFGDAAKLKLRARVVGVAASPEGGYWLATSAGRVYAFGQRATAPRTAAGVGRIIAIVS